MNDLWFAHFFGWLVDWMAIHQPNGHPSAQLPAYGSFLMRWVTEGHMIHSKVRMCIDPGSFLMREVTVGHKINSKVRMCIDPGSRSCWVRRLTTRLGCVGKDLTLHHIFVSTYSLSICANCHHWEGRRIMRYMPFPSFLHFFPYSLQAFHCTEMYALAATFLQLTVSPSLSCHNFLHSMTHRN